MNRILSRQPQLISRPRPAEEKLWASLLAVAFYDLAGKTAKTWLLLGSQAQIGIRTY